MISDSTGDGEGYFLTIELSQHMFTPEFLAGYNWAANEKQQKKKPVHEIPFNSFQNVLDLFFNVVFLADKTYTKFEAEEYFKNNCLNRCTLRNNRKRYKNTLTN